MKRVLIVGLFLCLGASLAHAGLEVPTNGSNQSGVGDISGWFCQDGTYTYTIDNGPANPLVYGTNRNDTQGICGDANNGVIQQFNWNLIPSGQHTIRIFLNGQLIDQATFNSTNIGTEFLTGAAGSVSTVLAGRNVTLTWQQNQQNFVITSASGGGPFSGTYYISATKTSDTCGLPQTGVVDTLTVSQDGSNLTGTIPSVDSPYSGTVDAPGNFILTQTNPDLGTSGACTFEVRSSLSGNFNSGFVTVMLFRRQVSGFCPSTVNCDVLFNGTLTKTSAVQGEAYEYMPFREGEGSSVDELIDSLFD